MLRTALNDPDKFTITYELVPRQGFAGKHVNRLLRFAEQAKADGRIKALSITDNPGGNPSLAPVAIGTELLRIGIEPLIHFSLKDKNRSQIGSHIYLYQRLRLRSLLVLGGDFPNRGYYGQGKPVYDLDTMQTLQLLTDMENGRYPNRSGKHQDQYPTPVILKGCIVSPFKYTEAEQVWQYARLLRKIKAGADFIITQVGFDMRKFEELTIFLRRQPVELPVLANVFIPSLPLARALAAGKLPGILFSGELLARMEAEAAAGADRARRARLDRAASMIARLKKYGYRGVHLGGIGLRFQDIAYVLDRVEELEKKSLFSLPDNDFPIQGTWHFYQNSRRGAEPVEKPLHPGSGQGSARIHYLAHALLFARWSPGRRLFARFCLFCARKQYRLNLLLWTEKTVKRMFFNCQMCGDCTLAQSAFLCPQWHCPKRLVNGPCGGSNKGRCEVFPERLCFWVRLYTRLNPRTQLADLAAGPHIPPKDWGREKTSSWVNFFSDQQKAEKSGSTED
ncbi:MAG: methylenetetrahydrofolate reductase C-terminal domain-containing protein [Candidatus Electrothrix sp. YB6]